MVWTGGTDMAKRYIKSTQSFSPILDIKDGVIITKDGRYFKLLEFSPINYDLRSPGEQATIIDAFSAALRSFPDQVHFKVISSTSDVSPYLEALSKRYDAEVSAGNTGCAELIDDQMDFISRVSRTQGVTRRFFVTFEYTTKGRLQAKKPPFDMIVDSLNRTARSIALAMESCGNTLVSRDDRDYILRALYECSCRGQSDIVSFEERKEAIGLRYAEANGGEPVDEGAIPVNEYIAPDVIDSSISPDFIKVDNLYIKYGYIPSDAYPGQAYGGWLQILFGYLDNVDVDFWLTREDTIRVKNSLDYQMRNARVRVITDGDNARDSEEVQNALSAGYYIKQALGQGEDLYYMASMLSVSAETIEDMDNYFREMREYCLRNDMELKPCTYQQEECYRVSLPLTDYSKGIFRKSKRNIMSGELGSFYPFTAYELADRDGVFLGINANYGSPVFLNQYDTTKYANASMIVLGPSGAGKTYLLSTMLLRMRESKGNLDTMVISPLKGTEFLRSCQAVGGEFVRIAPGSEQNINLLEIRMTDRGDSALVDEGYSRGSILSGKIQKVLDTLTILLPDRTEIETQVLDRCLKLTYNSFGITDDNESLYDPDIPGAYRTMPTLRDLYDVLVKEGGPNATRLHSVLNRYVNGSAANYSKPTNVDLSNRFIVFDVSDCADVNLPFSMAICLDQINDKVRADRTKPSLVAIDEIWRLMKSSKESARFCQTLYKELRGYGGSVIGCSQDLSDILSDEIGSAIVNNANFKFLLPMDKHELDLLASVVDITSEEIKKLKKTTLKEGDGGRRNALLIANNNHVFIRIEASPKEHDLITTNAADLRRIAAQKASERRDAE